MRRIGIALGIFALWPLHVLAQAPPPSPGPSTNPTQAQQGAYPNSRIGLQHFLEDLVAAVKSKDDARVKDLWQTTVLPDHAAWFARIFGDQEGAVLDARYQQQLAATAGPPKPYTYVASLDSVQFDVEPVVRYAITHYIAQGMFLSLQAQVDCYTAEAIEKRGTSSQLLGYFFYVDGNFRVVDELVFAGLNAARTSPLLPYISEAQSRQMLIYSTPPVPPNPPRPPGTLNTVILQVVIDTAGQVNSAITISGDPVLGEAAKTAVHLWRFHPYAPDGHPAPVETTITVVF